ncbi:hypothetical protein [Natronobacterium texcoconense]|uniref:Restriction endonuclease BglII n=1 Tax=Natronobacterium texcoconense TaxID=1095778 RepID=A0A1H1AKR5_NATTX|nr:hypothetical protein [Natronobacterium texcoconense]SDQ40279.1 hypothetical protein SAMN04489842_0727 [Natronobacterium texcoconense]
MEPVPSQTWSYRGAREILEEKGVLEELPIIAEAYDEYGGGNQNLADRRELLQPIDWEQEVTVRFEAPNTNETISRRANFDAYKSGVLLEHERGEQMRANWHLMKMEATYRDPRGFAAGDDVSAGVLLIPDYVNFPTLDRTKNDVQAVLGNYFGFSIPLFVWEYPTGD